MHHAIRPKFARLRGKLNVVPRLMLGCFLALRFVRRLLWLHRWYIFFGGELIRVGAGLLRLVFHVILRAYVMEQKKEASERCDDRTAANGLSRSLFLRPGALREFGIAFAVTAAAILFLARDLAIIAAKFSVAAHHTLAVAVGAFFIFLGRAHGSSRCVMKQVA